MTIKEAPVNTLQDELKKVNEWLQWSYSLVSKQGGWIMWNGNEEERIERYAREIKDELARRKKLDVY